MKTLYLKLANLNFWANNKTRQNIETIKPRDLQLKTPYGSLSDLIIHLFNAVNHWLDYIDVKYAFPRRTPDIDFQDWSQVLSLWKRTDTRLIQVVDSFIDDSKFEEIVEKLEMTIGDMILHLSHHSFYHRGQIAMFIRQKELGKLPDTDADTFFKETRKKEKKD